MKKKVFDKECTIALFDILGFRNIISKTPNESIKNLIHSLDYMADRSLVNSDCVGCMIYSDSIILYGRIDDIASEMNTAMVIISASNILGSAANNGLPLRGALCKGHMYINEENKQIMGPALIKAYELEQKQDWMGALILNEQKDEFLSAIHKDLAAPECVLQYKAPLKSGKIEDYLCIDWIFRTNKESIINSFEENTESHEVFRKRKNTVEYFDYASNINKDKYKAYGAI